jgi:hypothetical protein
MRQARRGQLVEPIGCDRHKFEIGLKARRSRVSEDRRPAIGVAAPGGVHRFMRARKAEMNDARVRPRKIKMVGAKQRARVSGSGR